MQRHITGCRDTNCQDASHEGRTPLAGPQARYRAGLLILLLVVLGLALWRGHLLDSPVAAQIQSGITYPTTGTTVGGEVTVLGTASTGSFQRYELYYKESEADDDTYALFDGGDEVVIQGVLGVWDTSLLTPGAYTLRMRVVKQDGNYVEHFMPGIRVDQTPPTPTPAPTVPPAADSAGVSSAEGALNSSVLASPPLVGRTISALGQGLSRAAPARAIVHLYWQRADLLLPTESDLQQVQQALTGLGISVEQIRTVPIARSPDGGSARGLVRFTTDQPTNVSFLLQEIRNRLTDPSLALIDVVVSYEVADCATLERSAAAAAIEQARLRAAGMAQIVGLPLGDLLAVQEIARAGEPTGCIVPAPLLGTGLIGTPDGVAVQVQLLVTFALPDGPAAIVPTAVSQTEIVPTAAPQPAFTPVPGQQTPVFDQSPLPTPTG